MGIIQRAVQQIRSSEGDLAATDAAVLQESTTIVDAMRHAAEPRLPPSTPAEAAPAPMPAPAAAEPSGRGARIDLDLDTLERRGFALPGRTPSRIAHEFRLIKRPVLNNALDKGPTPVRHGKRVMVTSAVPGEGKSFSAVNLALSIASERDHAVILIDGDVARPSVPRTLGIPSDEGLLDWLEAPERDLAELVHPTNVEKLSILMAGRPHPYATELLAANAMGRLLDELARRYPDSILIFDSPPLLLSSEARVLAPYMGQVLMIVEAGGTPQDTVMDALAMIKDCAIVNIVLNKARHDPAVGGYGYGYGYGYGAGPSKEGR